jgi:hypothetical protein
MIYRMNMSFKMMKWLWLTNKCPQNREEIALLLPFTPHIPRFDTPQGCLLRSAPISPYRRQDRVS